MLKTGSMGSGRAMAGAKNKVQKGLGKRGAGQKVKKKQGAEGKHLSLEEVKGALFKRGKHCTGVMGGRGMGQGVICFKGVFF